MQVGEGFGTCVQALRGFEVRSGKPLDSQGHSQGLPLHKALGDCRASTFLCVFHSWLPQIPL